MTSPPPRRPCRTKDVNARWQAEMAPFFQLEEGVAPDAAMTPLEEIFHLD